MNEARDDVRVPSPASRGVPVRQVSVAGELIELKPSWLSSMAGEDPAHDPAGTLIRVVTGMLAGQAALDPRATFDDDEDDDLDDYDDAEEDDEEEDDLDEDDDFDDDDEEDDEDEDDDEDDLDEEDEEDDDFEDDDFDDD